MHHTCYLKFGVSWSSVEEANKSIYMTQSGLKNIVQFRKEIDSNEVKLSKTEKNKEVKNFILNNVQDFLAYAIDYSLYDKFFSGKKF